jgi:hypothetical protein
VDAPNSSLAAAVEVREIKFLLKPVKRVIADHARASELQQPGPATVQCEPAQRLDAKRTRAFAVLSVAGGRALRMQLAAQKVGLGPGVSVERMARNVGELDAAALHLTLDEIIGRES